MGRTEYVNKRVFHGINLYSHIKIHSSECNNEYHINDVFSHRGSSYTDCLQKCDVWFFYFFLRLRVKLYPLTLCSNFFRSQTLVTDMYHSILLTISHQSHTGNGMKNINLIHIYANRFDIWNMNHFNNTPLVICTFPHQNQWNEKIYICDTNPSLVL